MRSTRLVTVVHPDVGIRILVKSLLEAHKCAVSTDHSLRDLARTEHVIQPDIILVDRTLVSQEGIDILTDMNRKWEEAHIVFLPEGLTTEVPNSRLAPQLLAIVDRMLQLKSTRDILAV